MKRTTREFFFCGWTSQLGHTMLRARMLVLMMLLSACGAAPTTQTGGVAQTSIVPSEATAQPTNAITPTAAIVTTPTVAVEPAATIEVGEATPAPEVATPTTSDATASSTASAGGGAAPVTAVMEQLGVEGEPFAAVGDPNAPITVIEFSDYG